MEARPFLLETPAGHVQALGTRFTVSHLDGVTRVAVFEGSVRLSPAGGGSPHLVLEAGNQSSFDKRTIAQPREVDEQTAAWKDGLIIADDMRLGDFVDQLARYRSGILRCDPAIAGLKVSGVFPLADTDRILATLPRVLPVRVIRRTRFWVALEGT